MSLEYHINVTFFVNLLHFKVYTLHLKFKSPVGPSLCFT